MGEGTLFVLVVPVNQFEVVGVELAGAPLDRIIAAYSPSVGVAGASPEDPEPGCIPPMEPRV